MLGIDVLQADGFAALRGKRIGLLTHPAGVNRDGVSTIEILRNAPGIKLVALYAVEHGLYNDMPAETPFPDQIDRRTGLPVFSLYNGKTKNFVPTRAQLQGIDALVIDLQDIGTRSYTFAGAMKSALEACFANGKEVIVLDRPNPLGGMKVDGPPMDAKWMSDVGRFRVPYVHGLTIGELALMARDLKPPGGIDVTSALRAHGKITVIPMRGWRRTMLWPDTGLAFVPTSTNIRDFETCEAYPMTGLGCMVGGFRNGIGSEYIFRGLSYPSVKPEIIERDLQALKVAGITFHRITVPPTKPNQPPSIGFLISIVDRGAWRPTELDFKLMKLACQLDRKNPFAQLTPAEKRTFLIHVGSTAFFTDLAAKGASIDVDRWLREWRKQADAFQAQSHKYWLYR
ncbi:MAG TPA: DUF1343 domain-containing protein [Lacunisphaera sp.]|jgi:uncharacterized protein YbbC (DUF1343 family)